MCCVVWNWKWTTDLLFSISTVRVTDESNSYKWNHMHLFTFCCVVNVSNLCSVFCLSFDIQHKHHKHRHIQIRIVLNKTVFLFSYVKNTFVWDCKRSKLIFIHPNEITRPTHHSKYTHKFSMSFVCFSILFFFTFLNSIL